MKFNRVSIIFFTLIVSIVMLTACSPATAPTQASPIVSVATQAPTATLAPAATAASVPITSTAATPPAKPDWFNIKMTDVRTGQTFSINDFSGKVVLVEPMAQWCMNCIFQQLNVRKMSEQLGNPQDLILISLDIDLNEDGASLKKYTADLGFEWRFAIATLDVERALGNLYSAEYLNPPLEPILLIDRQGNAHQLQFELKQADELQKIVEPYLAN